MITCLFHQFKWLKWSRQGVGSRRKNSCIISKNYYSPKMKKNNHNHQFKQKNKNNHNQYKPKQNKKNHLSKKNKKYILLQKKYITKINILKRRMKYLQKKMYYHQKRREQYYYYHSLLTTMIFTYSEQIITTATKIFTNKTTLSFTCICLATTPLLSKLIELL